MMLGILNPSEIDGLLQRGTVGRIGVCDGVRSHIMPVSYTYESDSVLASSAEGVKLRLLRERPRDVCFEVDEVDGVGNWRSVIGWGSFEELDALPSLGAMQFLVRHLDHASGGQDRVAVTAARMTHATASRTPSSRSTRLMCPAAFPLRTASTLLNVRVSSSDDKRACRSTDGRPPRSATSWC